MIFVVAIVCACVRVIKEWVAHFPYLPRPLYAFLDFFSAGFKIYQRSMSVNSMYTSMIAIAYLEGT